MNVPFTWRGASRVPQVILIGIMMEVPLRICALPGVMNSPITNLVALASTVFVLSKLTAPEKLSIGYSRLVHIVTDAFLTMIEPL